MALTVTTAGEAAAQQTKHLLKFGDMNQWVTRNVKESGIIGG